MGLSIMNLSWLLSFFVIHDVVPVDLDICFCASLNELRSSVWVLDNPLIYTNSAINLIIIFITLVILPRSRHETRKYNYPIECSIMFCLYYLNWAQFISIVFLVWIFKLILEIELIQIIFSPGNCPLKTKNSLSFCNGQVLKIN